MLHLTILFTSHYFLTISAQDGYLGKPRLHVIPEGEARLGSKVTIECISIYTIDGCKFYKNSELLQHSSSSFTETQYTFKSATALDEGLYTCQCSAYRIFGMKHWGRYTSPPADLVLNRNLEKPQIFVRCMERSNTCSKMKIECRISHYTLKECWFHRHGERQALYSNSSIDSGIQYVIQSVTMADEGPYTCECNSVQDKSTQTSDSVSLFIKPYLEIRVTPQGQIRLGSKVIIECNNSNSFRLSDCGLNKTNLHSSRPLSGIQYITESATAQDEGNYTCHCNVYGIGSIATRKRLTTELSLPLNFVINRNLEKPQILVRCMEGTNSCSKMMIECRNSHYTLKECWFRKDGEGQTRYSNSNINTGIQYAIQSVTRVDEGPYTCECNSVQDKSTQTSDPVYLFIKPYLEIHVTPQGKIRLGSKVTIECRSNSNRYRITDCGLFKTNLHSSRSLSGIQYVTESATPQDEANYTCQCNVYSADSHQYRTTELSLPFNLVLNRNLEKPQILVRCMEGINTCSKMMIECRISHYTLKECWFHKDGEGQTRYSNSNINSGIQYVIQSVKRADEGRYTCECNSVQDKSTQTSDPVYLFIKPYLEIRVTPQGDIRFGSKVTIECRSSSNRYRLTDCGLYKTNLDSSGSLSGIQYVTESATTQDEGNYTCQCNVYSADSRQYRTTELSLPFNLVLNRTKSHYSGSQVCAYIPG